MLIEEEKIYKTIKTKIVNLFKKNFLNYFYIIFLGAISSYSLPPYNYFIINFITFSLFFIFIFNKKKRYTPIINSFFNMGGVLDLDIFYLVYIG